MNDRENEDLALVLEKAREVFKRPEDWLERSVPALGGRTPRECIREGKTKEVLDLIEWIKDGMFV